MTLRLYDYVLSGSCYKVRLLAALLGIDYERVSIDFYPGNEHKQPDFLTINPAGTLPVLEDGDLVMTETQAILVYLASTRDSSGRWLPKDDPATLARVTQWLAFSSRLTDTAGAARLHDMLNRPLDIVAARRGAIGVFRELEAHLTERRFEGGTFLVGDHPTIADIACFAYVALAPDGGIEHDEFPAIRNWIHAIKSLDGFITMPGIHVLHERRDPETGSISG
ncbi:MAG: glutathione S-transferase family protein [Geminicoccaceae bacterium]